MDKFKYTERFLSFQGEGTHTGKSTLWLRWFQCNLNCNGFGQTEPTKPETHILPYETIDITEIHDLLELPVFEYGCDSSYSWSRRFEHLAFNETAEEIVNHLEDILTNPLNPDGKFIHASSKQETHMCFTGGEPMMRPSQRAMAAVLREFEKRNNLPNFITIETNGTQKISRDFIHLLSWFKENTSDFSEWFWSFSPKLYNTSGEENDKAIKPEVVLSYLEATHAAGLKISGHLKFVVNGRQETWDELDRVVGEFREVGVDLPVWIMPVGATKEQQETDQVKQIVNETLKRGYHVSGRLHAHMLGNGLGT